MSNIITLVVSVCAKEETIKELTADVMALAEATRKESGNICYFPHISKDNPLEIVFYEQWLDQAALDSHMREPHFLNFINDEKKLMATSLNVKELKIIG